MKIESRIAASSSSAASIYNYITDFRNFKSIIPQDQITDWTADTESCSFKNSTIGKMGMKIVEKDPHKLVKINSDPTISQYNFILWIQIKELDQNDSRVKITIEPQLNKILLPMVKGPLKQFVDSLAEKIEKFDFTNAT